MATVSAAVTPNPCRTGPTGGPLIDSANGQNEAGPARHSGYGGRARPRPAGRRARETPGLSRHFCNAGVAGDEAQAAESHGQWADPGPQGWPSGAANPTDIAQGGLGLALLGKAIPMGRGPGEWPGPDPGARPPGAGGTSGGSPGMPRWGNRSGHGCPPARIPHPARPPPADDLGLAAPWARPRPATLRALDRPTPPRGKGQRQAAPPRALASSPGLAASGGARGAVRAGDGILGLGAPYAPRPVGDGGLAGRPGGPRPGDGLPAHLEGAGVGGQDLGIVGRGNCWRYRGGQGAPGRVVSHGGEGGGDAGRPSSQGP
jgi:hypothetical protein